MPGKDEAFGTARQIGKDVYRIPQFRVRTPVPDHSAKKTGSRAKLLSQIEHFNVSPIAAVAIVKTTVALAGQLFGLTGESLRSVCQMTWNGLRRHAHHNSH